MSGALENKTILVTGALGKIGFAAVRMFLDRGAKVIANDWTNVSGHDSMPELLERYAEDRLLFMQADVGDDKQVAELFAGIENRFGCLDGSFHNAYLQHRKPVDQYSLLEWNQVIHGTLGSTFLICKYAIPLMRGTGGGSIVNTSSVLGLNPRAGEGAYGSAKAGINFLTQVIAAENAAYDIRANVIIPGDIKLPKPVTAERAAELKNYIRLGRYGTPDEVCELASFLLSDAASYITGSLYTIDGGFHL